MADSPRKKSPRSPSIALDEAIERATRIYERERRNLAPTDVVAQNIGYKNANNGAAIQVLASIRYYGLLERSGDGLLGVTKDLEDFIYAPTPERKGELLTKWLRSPPVFSDLLDKYSQGLPSDATLRYDLIQRGFTPPAAEAAMAIFRRSVEYAQYYERVSGSRAPAPDAREASVEPLNASIVEAADSQATASFSRQSATNDRIPVRLTGGRKAWLEIPTPFYSADKARLKAQIDLLLTEDDETLPE